MTTPARVTLPNQATLDAVVAQVQAIKVQIDAALATALTVTRAKGTTVQRPDPAVAGVAYMYYDTTLGRPIWSNGASWRFADGTAA